MSVYRHNVSMLPGSKSLGCVPRAGNGITHVPPGAIMLNAHGASSTGHAPVLRRRWTSCTRARFGASLISISFWMPVAVSTGWMNRTVPARCSTVTGALSGQYVRFSSSGACQRRWPP